MKFLISACGLCAFTVALASPTPNHKLSPRQSQNATQTSTPCQIVSSAYFAQVGQATPTVPARMAMDCLNTIPLNKTSATKLIDHLKPYVEWQSTLSYLRDPPADYALKVQPPVDVMASLNDIKGKVEQDRYISEWQVSMEAFSTSRSPS
jgi:hypothetical protein